MADAAVEFLLNNLKQLLIDHANLIKGAKGEVENLEKDLRLFRAFLKDSIKRRRKDDTLREVVRRIRDVVYDAEDVIDAFVTQAAINKSQSYFVKAFKTPVNLHEIATNVQSISKEVEKIYGDRKLLDFAALNIGDDGGPEEPEVPLVRQDNIVGFDDEADKIIGYLKEKTDNLDVISITGMPGQGKTTLAGKIFNDKRIQFEFPTRIWVYVSQDFSRKNVFLSILGGLTKITEDMHQQDDLELAKMIKAGVEKGKFLIVMDDVWAPEDWDKIRIAFPETKATGKILITSRDIKVAWFANRDRDPHKLRFLNQDESWLLFKYEVFRKPECPSDLEVPGKVIVGRCAGLPLAIVVIGGILAKKFSATDNMILKKAVWAKVSVSAYLKEEDPERRMEKIIALSYDKLPNHLRACFLYLGMFPEDFEIPVWKLIRMWIAEGFIQQKDSASLEETAESYLDELINRNLVRVDKRRPNGRVKTCRMHDMLRDFCINEAGNEKENFLQEIKRTPGRCKIPDPAVEKYRRICIHSNVLNFITSARLGPRAHVRSFVCFSKEDLALPAENTSAIPAAFKLLRVLDAKSLKFEKVPSEMYQLLHLRYVALSFNLAVLPAAFSKLWNLETLIADTTSRTLEIKVDLWKLSQLRHVKTNASATLLSKGSKRANEGENLQTLGTISPLSCTEQVFDRARNLKKLGIRGKLALLLDNKNVSFDRLGKSSSLEKLKLLNDVFPYAASDDPLPRLPPPYQFPPKLRSLTLSDTFLNWSEMSTLGLLENLEVLKLKSKAFMGPSWEAKDGGFRCLEFLHIGRTNLTVWKASQHHYPRLRCLELHNCEELKEIPIGLADIPSFQLLDLHRSNHAAASANKIHEAKIRQDIKDCEFRLSIFPITE